MPIIDWDGFFAAVREITRNDPRPYVTRLAKSRGPYDSPRAFAVLIATVISLRTRDKVNEAASERLFQLICTPDDLAALPVETIVQSIRPCTFYLRKAVQLQKIATILLEEHDGTVPNSLDELLKLPGVGRKTANLVLVEGFNKMGICVDTHVHRILNELGFVKTRSPDETELVLREILPKKHWKKVNCQLVMLGMFHCPPGRPLAGECARLKRFLTHKT